MIQSYGAYLGSRVYMLPSDLKYLQATTYSHGPHSCIIAALQYLHKQYWSVKKDEKEIQDQRYQWLPHINHTVTNR